MLWLKAPAEAVKGSKRSYQGDKIDVWKQTVYLVDTDKPYQPHSFEVEFGAPDEALEIGSEIPFTQEVLQVKEDRQPGRKRSYFNIGVKSNLPVPSKDAVRRAEERKVNVVATPWDEVPREVESGFIQKVAMIDPDTKLGHSTGLFVAKRAELLEVGKLYRIGIGNFEPSRGGGLQLVCGNGFEEFSPNMKPANKAA